MVPAVSAVGSYLSSHTLFIPVIPAPDQGGGQAPSGIQFSAPLSFPWKRESRNLMNYCVYILASKRNGTLYIGVTSNLQKRVYEHKTSAVDGFTKKYEVHLLVWYECTEDIELAITKEKQLKKWNRKWKLDLIEKENPEWEDLYDKL